MKTKRSNKNCIILNNDVELTKDEYYYIHNFFVTYSLCKKQSRRKRTLKEYGLLNGIKDVKKELNKIISFEDCSFEIIPQEELLVENLVNNKLNDDCIFDLTYERGMVIETKEKNEYFKLFYFIRNSLSHGEYTIKINDKGEKFIIMQNSEFESPCIKARMVMKVSSLINIIKIIDKNKLLMK